MRSWCLAVARRHAGPDDAEDVAQEAVLRAWRSRRDCSAPDQPWRWLAVITHREALRRRSRRGEVVCDEVADRGVQDAAVDAAADRLTIWPAVATLPAVDRRILLMHYGHDMTVAAIAVALELPTGTVKVKLSRSRAKLRTVLSP